MLTMISYLNFNVTEPFREGNRMDLTWDILQKYRNQVSISKKFNDYLKGKSVIVVGPSPYMEGKGYGEFIDSFDVVVRMNKAWKPTPEQYKDFGKKTDIRWHCMMEHPNNGGPFDIQEMKNYGVKWLASAFPRNLDYFHNDNIKFEEQNQNQLEFHVPSDLVYYLNIHRALETRPNVAPTAIFDLINYDLDRLHLSGVSFFKDGWAGDYKKDATNVDQDGKYQGMKDMQKEGHAQEAQMHLMKLFLDNESKFSVDKEIENILSKL